MICKRQRCLDVRVFLAVAWISPESRMGEVWHIFALFAARKVVTNPLYFLGIVDVRDDGSTRYLR